MPACPRPCARRSRTASAGGRPLQPASRPSAELRRAAVTPHAGWAPVPAKLARACRGAHAWPPTTRRTKGGSPPLEGPKRPRPSYARPYARPHSAAGIAIDSAASAVLERSRASGSGQAAGATQIEPAIVGGVPHGRANGLRRRVIYICGSVAAIWRGSPRKQRRRLAVWRCGQGRCRAVYAYVGLCSCRKGSTRRPTAPCLLFVGCYPDGP